MSSVFESAIDLFNQGDSLSKLGGALGTDSSDTSKALGAAGPALIGGLADKANSPGGPDQVGSLLDHNDGSVLGNIGGSFSGNSSGDSLVSSIFGNGLDGIVSKLASSSGLSGSVITKALPALAPIITGIVAKKRAEGALSNTQVASLLASEKADLVKGGRLGGLAGGAATARSSATGAASSVRNTATGAASSVGNTATGAASSVGSTATGAVGSVGNTAKGGLSWLWPAIAVVAALIFLAWLLTQCNDDEAGVSAESTVAAESDSGSGDAADSDLQASVDTALADSDGVTGTVDADGVVTLTGEVADEAAKTAAEEAAEGVEGVTSVDNQLTVGDGSGDAADSDLQASVDTALADSDGVTGTVDADGVVTLTGEVADEAAKTAAEEAAEGVEGVTSVDNQLTVGDGSDSETETVNEQLDLAPITFEVNQAVITAEGQAVLDEAAAYFESNADVTFEIGGHTDSDGDDASNLTLSQSRADAVKTYLEGKGIDASRMTTKGYGEANPKVENDTPENKAINRRIEFTVG